MLRILSTLLVTLTLATVARGAVTPGHRLPEGPLRPVRERTIDLQRLTAELTVDLEQSEIWGEIAVRFTPLRADLESFVLDAADLDIQRVELVATDPGDGTAREARSAIPLGHAVQDRQLRVELPRPARPGDTLTVRIAYACRPTSGLYFFPGTEEAAAQAWNYGEGGLHYGWLPLYNDTDDRFAVELRITVARPYVALGNGSLAATRDNPDGTRTFHWIQEEEIPNYLLALNVGAFTEVRLGSARVGSRNIPLSVWVPAGREEAAAFAFRDTPRMLEFFSRRFGYPYVWSKYDQVVLREFEGAMETTTMVGFGESYPRLTGDPADSSPDLDQASSNWSYQDTIAHELAHHWFGDLVTCRSLASLWLNESFASFAHTLWNGHANGDDDLTYQRWRYRNAYLDWVRSTGEVRPLEYPRFAATEDMYQEETTYIKGALVLHMLQHFVGEDDFWRAVAAYLETHAFSQVDSTDFQTALERATGRNLSWFFGDWIVDGGGHPVLEVSYLWNPERREVDLTVHQVQADLPFENLFRLPVDVEIVTAEGARAHTVQLDNWTTRVALPAASRPLRLTFDKGNWLVAEIAFERSPEEVLAQLEQGDLAARLQAARQIATDFPRRPEGAEALRRVLADGRAHWGLRQEVALDLGTVGGQAATEALTSAAQDDDRRVRRAAALGLGRIGSEAAAKVLRRLVEADTAEEVVAVAAFALGRMRAPGAAELLTGQLERDSQWWNVIRIGAMQGLAELGDRRLVSTFRDFVDSRFERQLRMAALDGWFRAAPEDPALAAVLRELAHDPNLAVRSGALAKLGRLHRAEDLSFLREYAAREPDENLARAARDAVELIEAFNPSSNRRIPLRTATEVNP